MDRQTARLELKARLTEYVNSITQPSQKAGHNAYNCPLCHSGEGKNGTGAFFLYDSGTKWKCHACGAGGDIFDLIGQYEEIEDNGEQLKRAASLYGVELEQYQKQDKNEQKQQKNCNKTEEKPYENRKETVTKQQETVPAADYTAFFLQANQHITETDYHRGLTLETLNRFKVGYIPAWRHPKAKAVVPTSPRLIIPTSKESYIARDTRQNIEDYKKQKVGKLHIFNVKGMYSATKPVYIVEGEIDAMSICDVGGEAVGLGSTTQVNRFLELVEWNKPAQLLIIAMDNDEAGAKATADLKAGLEKLNIPCAVYNPAGNHKDANEALTADREAFSKAVALAETATVDNLEALAANIKKQEYISRNSVASHLQEFIDGIAASVNTPFIPTGFAKLDSVLDGGLYEGLYIVGAISSLGKTTLITQIADQIAQAGTDILIFSLEMARTEIMAKSISRHTLQNVLENGGNVADAKTTRGITTGKRYFKNDAEGIRGYSQTELSLIDKSIEQYGEYADHIYITEGLGNVGTEQIRKTALDHISFTGNTPVIVVDYLQIITPADARSTDKQNTDKAVLELKRISRDLKTPVIAISSFNRANYNTPVSMEAFKESGAVEYSSDVLIGLQLQGVGGENFDVTAAKAKNPREVELVILKNRNGAAGGKVSFLYYPQFNFYQEETKGSNTLKTEERTAEPFVYDSKTKTKTKLKK